MAKINRLDHQTIDKIAAGEVVERPSSVVKELVENAIDAGADAITVELKEGGITFIRVTDNGCGIEKSQVENAFLRHATSKIASAEDLTSLVSLGFRGEALSSIAAVAQVELITKTAEDLTGLRFVIEGGVPKEREEIGAPTGSTLIVRNLFFNTPPRKKFLKQPRTEGAYVADLMEHLALSHADISFKFLLNGQTKFYTTGNGNLREIVFRIYGREVAGELIDFHSAQEGMAVTGLLGKAALGRANRSYEIFFVNGRYIRSALIGGAVEEAYREYLMQRKFPFCILHFTVDTEAVDVNVHPTKMEVRIADGPAFYEQVRAAVQGALQRQEMIPEVSLGGERRKAKENAGRREAAPEPFEARRLAGMADSKKTEEPRQDQDARDRVTAAGWRESAAAGQKEEQQSAVQTDGGGSGDLESEHLNYVNQYMPRQDRTLRQEIHYGVSANALGDASPSVERNFPLADSAPLFSEQAAPSPPAMEHSLPETAAPAEAPEQMTLFSERLFSEAARARYEIIGQLFETYWLIAFQDKLLIVDQHAAHEKVKYERLLRHFEEKEALSQALNPPLIVTLSNKELECYLLHAADFAALGFEVEAFGGNDYAIRGVPLDLYGCGKLDFFREILEELAAEPLTGAPESVRGRLAAMACKAAVKGNMRTSRAEMESLLDELLTLENPYNCPHGRPTMISMSKYEIEKKFRRIV